MARRVEGRHGPELANPEQFEADTRAQLRRGATAPRPRKRQPELTTASGESAVTPETPVVHASDTNPQPAPLPVAASAQAPAPAPAPAPAKETKAKPAGERARSSTSKPAVSITVEEATRARLKELAQPYGMKMLPLVLHAVSSPDVPTTLALVQEWQRKVEERQRRNSVALLPGMEVPRATLRTRENPIEISLRLGDATKKVLAERAEAVGADGIGQLIDVCVAALPDSPTSR